MQTILGSGGAIGTELAKELLKYTDQIRLASRTPVKVNPNDEILVTDLLQPDNMDKAVEGSSVVYVTIGFSYSAKVWKENWPRFIDNVVTSCNKFDAKLVFFDNIYMYDPAYLDGMNEKTPDNPISKKGEIRKRVADRIMSSVEAGNIQALIARCADYYGPSIKNTSMLTEMVFKNLSQGRKAMWLMSDQYRHSYTYTKDAGKATALLGNTDTAYNQIWHLPTSKPALTGKELITLIAREMGVQPKYQIVSKLMLRMIGLFVPVMKEMVEMAYQYDRHYEFDSRKFEEYFDFKPTPYLEGIREIIETDYK